MTLSPCPTTAAYSCIYSAEKQNSYCCAPVETAAHALTIGSRYNQVNNPRSQHSHRNAMSSKTQPQINTNDVLKQQYQQHLQFQQQKNMQGYANNGQQQPCQSPALSLPDNNGCGTQENNPFINFPGTQNLSNYNIFRSICKSGGKLWIFVFKYSKY